MVYRLREFCFYEPIGYHPGNTPRIGGNDEDYVAARLDGRSVAGSDFCVQVCEGLLKRFRKAPCNISAVAGSRKTKNHMQCNSISVQFQVPIGILYSLSAYSVNPAAS